jgi:hypothetical protein
MGIAIGMFVVAVASFVAGALYGRKLSEKAHAEADAVLDNLRKHV